MLFNQICEIGPALGLSQYLCIEGRVQCSMWVEELVIT